ncbi:tetratricopeptide repeat protein [Qipengyuania sp. 6B39]|uniref:tetratricopeptide repeat protein n=1 Tax=Qipengyuania proteolytica TaxID=2867239 RepID=UPI001C8AACCC|nr:tetratricopeptide repeat protein [Qipengyuania proteolytica]MBX7496037.1 tetratricopeptide repeat protein [Qipengyuania proteolytica]
MSRIRLFASPIVLAMALAACAPDPETRFADAQAAFAANDFRGARVSLIAGLKDQPGNHEMRLLLAQAQIALGDGEGAATSLAALPAEWTDDPRVLLARGEAEVLRGRFDEAVAAVEPLETGAADRIRALAAIGKEDFAAAAEAFAAGAAREPVDAKLLASYARFELAHGNRDKAGALLDRAIETDSKLVEAYLVRAELLAANNDLASSLMAYDKALDLHPGNFDGRLGKAGILARLGRYDDAAVLAEGLAEEAPDDRALAFVNARVARGRREWETVRATLQPLEDELRAEAGMAALYGEALIELGQPAVGLGVLEPELRRQPNARPIRRLVARAQLAARDAAGALATIRPLATRPDATPDELKLAAAAAKATGSGSAATFEQRLDQPSPEWIGGELAKADRALRNRQWQDAETRYETILSRTGGTNAMVLNNLAFVKGQLGKTDAALDHALAAAKLEPDNASILDTAGWLLVQTGSKARGLEMLQRAARLAPDNATIQRHLDEAKTS